MSEGGIIERKRLLDGTFVEFPCEPLLVAPPSRAVLRYVIENDRALPGTDLKLAAGTITIAHYWADRPYNVYHWMNDGHTVAYYCNVVDSTSISADLVSYLDLAVDVLIDLKGNALVLDEDELPTDLAPPLRLTVARALDQLSGQSKRIAAEVERESLRFL